MTTHRTGWMIVGATAAALALALGWQRHERAALSEEMERARAEKQSIDSLRAENRRLAAERVSQEEFAQLRADRAALPGLRQEIDAMKARLTAAGSASPEAPLPPSEPANEIRRSETLHDAGRATPIAAGETFVWALQRGDVERAAAMIAFSREARARMEAILPTLPASVRATYDTPEKLMAFVMAGSPAIAAYRVTHEVAESEGTVSVRLELLGAGGPRYDWVKFERDAEGWKRLILPPTVEKLANFLQGREGGRGGAGLGDGR